MSFRSVMIHVDLGVDNAQLLRTAKTVVRLFDARAIGVAACQPMQIFAGDAYVSGELVEEDRVDTDRLMQDAERMFRAAFSDAKTDIRWRSFIAMAALADVVGDEARCADLIVIAPSLSGGSFDPARRVGVGDLLMSAGRPVLLAPDDPKGLDLDEVVVGWKDSRETRRAVVSALPFLKKAKRVTVLEAAPQERLPAARERLASVVDWLSAHGVAAEPLAELSKGDDSARIHAVLAERRAGLFVAGAYGHSRVREWVFGGVTRGIVAHTPCVTLLCH